MGGAEGEAVDGAEEALVVGGRRLVRELAGESSDQGDGDALGARQGEVGVHVVAVGRVDVVAQPDPGVGDAQAGRGEGGGDRRGRAGGGVRGGVEGEWRAGHRDPVEERLGEARVVVAGDEDDLDVADRRADLGERRQRQVERRPERPFAQLDHVAEQHEAVGAAQLLEQDGADPGVADHVAAAGGAEVEVGDDRCLHL